MPLIKKFLDDPQYEYPIDTSLCVTQSITDNESQYEAFQSILAHILSANFPPLVTEDKIPSMTPYELLCFKNGILLTTDESIYRSSQKSIFFKPSEVTHYKSTKGDPYELYQAKNTQGFCQMFAFFIIMSYISGFQIVDQSKKIDIPNFTKLANNTLICGIKTVKTLKANEDVYAKFNTDFMKLASNKKDRDHFGIKEGTTTEQFLTDFQKFSLKDVMYYIFDNPLNGHIPGQTYTDTFWKPLGLDRPDDRIGQTVIPQSPLSGVKRSREEDVLSQYSSPTKRRTAGGRKTKRRSIKKIRRTMRRKRVT